MEFSIEDVHMTVQVADRSKARVCGRSLAGIAGSNPAGGMDVCVLCECCVCSGRGLCDGPDPSSRGVLPSVMCHCVCDLETSGMRRPALGCCVG